MEGWGKFIVGAISTEAIVEILIHSELFDRPRNWLRLKSSFFDSLLSCGWCLSVWVAGGVFGVIAIGGIIVLYPIVIHRMSNYIHMAFGLLRKARWGKEG